MAIDAFSTSDEHFMQRAIRLARRGLYTTDPNPRVGCVLVRDGVVVGEGWHEKAGGPHAEVHALRAAGDKARGSTAYVTLEPCSHTGRTGPCAEALVDASVARVIAADRDPNPEVSGQGIDALRRHGLDVGVGLMADEAAALNPGYLSRMTRGRSFVRVKSAMSLDGRTALANGKSLWITGEEARADVHTYRARSSCIITGIRTVLADDPKLTARVAEPVTSPSLVIMDRELRCPPGAQVLAHPGGCTIAYIADDRPELRARADALTGAGATLLPFTSDTPEALIEALVTRLARDHVNEIMVEAGPTLAGAWLRAGVVDEWVVYIAANVLGPDARPLVALPRI
ncbi:MAG: bifunctional diaminohydroxyphosphoribosylaminopyrimidine deaminase/5-amino-6-(5-phosphoribosylamino)uracil reductase RibD, partial [Pseudomonadota bacterium]